MKKRLFLITLIVLIVCSNIFAAGKTEETKTNAPVGMKISTWTSNKDQIALLQSFVDEFAEKKGIQIQTEFETIPFAEYTTKLSLELQGSSAPDVFWILETAAPAFIQSKLLAPLDKALTDYNFEDFSKGAMGLWQSGNTTYAVPFSTSPFFVLYNADLFEKAGLQNPEELNAQGLWTWEKFQEVCKIITANTGVFGFQTVDGGGYDARILHNLLPIIRSYGGDAWTKNGKILINSKESVKGIQLFHDMVYVDGSVVPPGNQSDFYSGSAAMTVAQVSRVSKLADASFKWGMVSMPSGPQGKVPVLGQAAIGANAESKNSELATELVAYMTSESCVSRMAGIWPPARFSVLNSEAFLTSNAMVSAERMKECIGNSIMNGQVIPSHVLYPQIEVDSKMVWDKLWKAGANVQAIADEVAAVYSKYIK